MVFIFKQLLILLFISGNVLCVFVFTKKKMDLKPSFSNILKCLSLFDILFLVGSTIQRKLIYLKFFGGIHTIRRILKIIPSRNSFWFTGSKKDKKSGKRLKTAPAAKTVSIKPFDNVLQRNAIPSAGFSLFLSIRCARSGSMGSKR